MNQEQEIKPGDTVRLKSGGLTMTVSETYSDTAKCCFYNESKAQFEELPFPIIVLTTAY